MPIPQTPISKVYTFLDYTNDIVIMDSIITDGLFPTGVGTLSTFYTSSYQSDESKEYYLTINDADDSEANELFDIIHLVSGSILSASENVMYKEFANLLLSEPSDQFSVNDVDCTNLFGLCFKRNLLKEELDIGNWELIHSGKHFIDDSGETDGVLSLAGRAYNVVSGSVDDGAYNDTPIGLFYPKLGIILIDNSALSGSNADNVEFFSNISSISARNKQVLKENNYFCRIKNREYNYTNNPTFLSSSSAGEYLFTTFVNNPRVFPTTIGLYNDNNELLATAKLSHPFEKGFDSEMSIKVKLSF